MDRVLEVDEFLMRAARDLLALGRRIRWVAFEKLGRPSRWVSRDPLHGALWIETGSRGNELLYPMIMVLAEERDAVSGRGNISHPVRSNNWNSWNANWLQSAVPRRYDRCYGVLGCYSGPVRRIIDPFRFLLISVAGWLGQRERDAVNCQIATTSARSLHLSGLGGHICPLLLSPPAW